MMRATAVKAVAALLVALELSALPAGPGRTALVVLTVLATVAFFTWAIVSPRAQFLVPSVHALPSSLATSNVAFTFDDGPDPVMTPAVLELLARRGARATFFVVGSRAAAHPELVRRIVAEGHAVGSHTYAHAHVFHFLSPSRMRREVEDGMAAVEAITARRPRLFRPPQGLRTPLLRDALAPLEVRCVTWTERGLDGIGRTATAIVRRLERHVRPGAILTLHDGAGLGGTLDRRPTLDALGTLLDLAERRGLRCVSLAALEETA